MSTYYIDNKTLSIECIAKILNDKMTLAISEDSKSKIEICRKYLDNKMETYDGPIYGINTGFGSLYNISIGKLDLSKLQENLMMSHACGVGDEVPQIIVKIMLLLKIQSLSYGHSGVQLATVERLIEMFNQEVLPVVYQQGSLGASGDLAPLAHLSLPLIGMGKVNYNGKRYQMADLMSELNWQPIKLQSKEGLALLNGTQFMSAYGVYILLRSYKLEALADIVGAISLDAFDGRIEPFHDAVHQVRPHKGQIDTARRIRNILADSELISQYKAHVQDPYSFRCIPQVHGASKDSINYAASVFLIEINSVTDNPTIFPDQDLIISAGNFHGQPLALALDNLSIALAEIGNISERRTYQLIKGNRGLPSFLVANPGLNSGFMIPQYAAASLVSLNKQYASPSSVDSIESSQGQEDHVSMGANAATKAYKIMQNLERIIAIELMNAAQALEFRRPKKSSPVIEEFVAEYRKYVSFIENDKIMQPEIAASVRFIENVKLCIPNEGDFAYDFKTDLNPINDDLKN